MFVFSLCLLDIQSQAPGYLSCGRHGLPLVKQILSRIRDLITASMCMPSLHPLCYCAMVVICMVIRHYSWVGFVVASLLLKLVW